MLIAISQRIYRSSNWRALQFGGDKIFHYCTIPIMNHPQAFHTELLALRNIIERRQSWTGSKRVKSRKTIKCSENSWALILHITENNDSPWCLFLDSHLQLVARKTVEAFPSNLLLTIISFHTFFLVKYRVPLRLFASILRPGKHL